MPIEMPTRVRASAEFAAIASAIIPKAAAALRVRIIEPSKLLSNHALENASVLSI